MEGTPSLNVRISAAVSERASLQRTIQAACGQVHAACLLTCSLAEQAPDARAGKRAEVLVSVGAGLPARLR